MQTYPRVKAVTPLPDKKLWVSFRNGQARIYNCEPLLLEPAFHMLQNEAFFGAVQADPHGYGVIWSDEVDLSEAELWLNGEPQPQEAVG
jgi:hypothetical protein